MQSYLWSSHRKSIDPCPINGCKLLIESSILYRTSIRPTLFWICWKTPIISSLLFFSGTEPNICRVRIQCHHNVEGLNHLPCVSPLLSPRCRSTMLPEGRLQIDRQARIEIYDSLNEDHKPSHNFNNQPHWRDKIKVVTKISRIFVKKEESVFLSSRRKSATSAEQVDNGKLELPE